MNIARIPSSFLEEYYEVDPVIRDQTFSYNVVSYTYTS